MLAIEAIYDGKKFVALEDFPVKKKFKVIITFIEEFDEAEELRDFTAQTKALDFWENEEEDIYQDFLLTAN